MRKMTIEEFKEFQSTVESALAVTSLRVKEMMESDNPQVVVERLRLQGYERAMNEISRYLKGDRFDLRVSAMRNF